MRALARRVAAFEGLSRNGSHYNFYSNFSALRPVKASVTPMRASVRRLRVAFRARPATKPYGVFRGNAHARTVETPSSQHRHSGSIIALAHCIPVAVITRRVGQRLKHGRAPLGLLHFRPAFLFTSPNVARRIAAHASLSEAVDNHLRTEEKN